MDENLVGYLLKALDGDEQRELENYLRQHPEAQMRLEQWQRRLELLARDTPDAEPPPDLWVSTLARVVEHKCCTLPAAPPREPAQVPTPRLTWWRRADVLVAACLLVLVGALATAWLAGFARDRYRVECENNLRQFQQALWAYADEHNGQFPQVESQPPHNFAGSFIPALTDAGVMPAGLNVSCPGSPPRAAMSISFAQLDALRQTEPDEFRDITRTLAGCYAYTLGYRDEASGEHRGLTRSLDGRTPIMSDVPNCASANEVAAGNSPNHGGKGQNVLFIDGHVDFKTTRNVGLDYDDIFLNADQRVGAGRNSRDTVLGRSDAVPYPGLDE